MSAFGEKAFARDRQPGDRLILWLPLFLGLGIGTYFLLSAEPPRLLGFILFSLSMLTGIMTWPLRDKVVWRYGVALCVLFSLGFTLAQLRTQNVDTALLTQPYFGATVKGKITHVERMGVGWRVMISRVRLGKSGYDLRLTVRQKNFAPAIGGYLEAKASLMPPSPPLLPRMYDFQRHAYFKGIGGYGYVTKILNYNDPPKDHAENDALETYRNYLAKRVYERLKQPEAGIVTALLNGQRGGIADKTTQSLQQSGLQHIISISGLHVGLMAGIVFYLVRFLMALNMRLALNRPIKKIAAAISIVAIIAYMLVVGQDPATVRSVIMTSIVLFAMILDREAINLRIVAFAALALLLLRPESVLDIGFQLSFSAVTALVAFYQYTHDFWQKPVWHDSFALKIIRPVILAMITTIIATIATAPLVLTHFQQIPMLSILSNALATPVVAFIIMPGTFLAYLFTPFAFLGDWAIQYMGWGTRLLFGISDFVISLPLAVWRIAAIPLMPVLLFMAGLFAAIALPARWRFVAVIPIIVAVLVIARQQQPDLFLAGNRIILMPDREKGIVYAEGKIDGFSKNLFLQYMGMKEIKLFSCEGDICRIRKDGKTIALIRTVAALEGACRIKADIIVTRYYLDKPCRDTVVIDRHKIEEQGGAAITIQPFFVATAVTAKGRPWQKPAAYASRRFRSKQGWSSHRAKANIGLKRHNDDHRK